MNAVRNIVELENVISQLDGRLGLTHGDLNFALMFRGQEDNRDLVPHLSGDLQSAESALREMIAFCRSNGVEGTNKEIYFKMRHAGLPSHLVDWSQSWKVALWFAIHDGKGNLSNVPSNIWLLRPDISDVQRKCYGTDTTAPTMFFADQYTCERSEHQEAMAYCIRFLPGRDLQVVPMNKDPLYDGRIAKVPLTPDSAARVEMENELLREDETLRNLGFEQSPLSQDVIRACMEIYAQYTTHTVQERKD